MDLTKVPHRLILAQFKANHGFSHSDVASMFLESVGDATQWAKTGAPHTINMACIACDKAIERWQQASGAFSDIDRQLYESQIAELQRSIQDEKSNHNNYVSACESESIIKIVLKRAKRKLVPDSHRVAAEDLKANDLVKINENGAVSLAGSSYIYVGGELIEKNYATLEAENAALKDEVAELKRSVFSLKSRGGL